MCLKSGTDVNRLDASDKYFNLQNASVTMTPEFDIKLSLKSRRSREQLELDNAQSQKRIWINKS